MISLPQARTVVLIAMMLAITGLALIVTPVLAQETPAQQNAAGTITITGTPQVGQPLTATDSGVEDADGLPAQEEWSYQWQSSTNGTDWNDIAGAVSNQYSPGQEQAGRLMKVQMSFTDNGGNAEALTSDAAADAVLTSDAVWTAVLTVGELVTDNNILGRITYTGWRGHGPPIPEGGITDTTFSHNGHDFSIAGIHVLEAPGEDAKLVMALHTGGEGDENSRSTLILRAAPNGEEDTFALAGKTPEYTEVDQPKLLKWTYNDHGWTKGGTVLISMTSNTVTEQVAASGKIEFAGGAVVNSQLTAVPTGVSDVNGLPDPVVYTYRWERSGDGENWNEIAGATSAAYTPPPADAGHLLRVEATFEDSQDNTEILTATVIDTDVTSDPRPEAVKPEGALWAAVLTPGTDTTRTDDRHGWDAGTGTLTDLRFYYNESNANSNYYFRSLWENPANKTLRLTFVKTDSGNAPDRAKLMLLAGPDNDQRKFRLKDATDATNGNDMHMTWDEEDVEWAGNALGWNAGAGVLLQIVEMEHDRPSWGIVTITGSPYPGETLTAEVTEVGDGNGVPDNVTYEWQWQSLDAQGLKLDIENATSSTYEVTPEDNGKELLAQARFTDALRYEEELVSSWIPVQADATGTITVTGAGQVGTSLATAIGDDIADPNGMPDNPVYTYQWQTSDDGENWSDIDGETGSTYQPQDADAGMLARVIVSFNDDEENEESLTSTPSTNAMRPADAVFASIITITNNQGTYDVSWHSEGRVIDIGGTAGTVTDGDFDYKGKTWEPEFLQMPNSVREASDGETNGSIFLDLKVSGTYDPEDHATLRLNIADGAETLSLYLKDTQYKHMTTGPLDTHRFQSDDVFNSWEVGDKVLITISEMPADQPATGNVTTTGTPQVGETLTASVTGVTDGNGVPEDVTYSYHWQRSNDGAEWTAIEGETGDSYEPTSDDLGRLIRVQISFRDSDGWINTLQSAATTDSVADQDGHWAAILTADAENEQRNPNIGWLGVSAKYGAISDSTFTLNGEEFALNYLLYEPTTTELRMEFPSAKAGTPEIRQTLTLHLSDGSEEHILNFQDADDRTSGIFTKVEWSSGVPVWEAGQTILVQIKPMGQQEASGNPAVTGTPTVGTALTADTSAITDPNGLPETPAYTYEWERSDDGSTWTAITGATAVTYTPAPEDAGMLLRVNVTFEDESNNAEARPGTPAADAVIPEGALWAAYVTLSSTGVSGQAGWDNAGTFADGAMTDTTFTFEGNDYDTTYLALPLATQAQADRALNHRFGSGLGGDQAGRNRLRLHVGTGDGEVALNLDKGGYGGGLNGEWQNISQGWAAGDKVLVTMYQADANQRANGTVTITGTMLVNTVLTAAASGIEDGNGLPDPLTLRYQWQRIPNAHRNEHNFTNIESATGATYTPVEDDRYHHLRVIVSFEDNEGHTETIRSTETAEYIGPSGALWTTRFNTQQGEAPLAAHHGASRHIQPNTRFPGTAFIDHNFDFEGITFHIDELHTDNAGENLTLVLHALNGRGYERLNALTMKLDNGKSYPFSDAAEATVEGINRKFTWDADGYAFEDRGLYFISMADEASQATGTVTVTGNPREDHVLTAAIGGDLADPNGLPANPVYTYQWQTSPDEAEWSDIAGATGAAYTVKTGDIGKNIRVQVSFKDALGTRETLAAPATTPAAPGPRPATGAITLQGDAIIGSTLTAGVGADLADPNGIPENPAYTYQWERSPDNETWTAITGATAETYETTSADIGMLIRVIVSFPDNDGHTEALTSPPTRDSEDALETVRTQASFLATHIKVVNSAQYRGALTADGITDRHLMLDTQRITIDQIKIAKGVDNPKLEILATGAPSNRERLTEQLGDRMRLVVGTGEDQVGINFRPAAMHHSLNAEQEHKVHIVWQSTVLDQWQPGDLVLIQILVRETNQTATGTLDLTGNAVIGQTLTATLNNVGDPNGMKDIPAYTYQWQRNTNGNSWVNIDQETGTTYEISQDDLGALLRARVTFKDIQDYTETLNTPATEGVAAAAGSLWTSLLTVGGDLGTQKGWSAGGDLDGGSLTDQSFNFNGQEYQISRVVKITKAAAVGVNPDIYLVLQFAEEKDGNEAGRNNLILTVTKDGTAEPFQLRTAARYLEGSDQTDAAWQVPTIDWSKGDRVILSISELPANQEAAGNLAINGTPHVSHTLTVDLNGVSDPNGLAAEVHYSHQWQISDDGSVWTNIDGGTANTYDVNAQDVGRMLRVVVTFNDRYGYEETITSEAAGPVAGIPTPVMVEEAVYIVWNTGGNDGATGYQVLRRELGSSQPFAVLVEDTGNTNTFHKDDTAETGVKYEYAVRAITPDGMSDQSNSVIGIRIRSNTPATGNPVITGAPKVGTALTADVSGIADANGIDQSAFRYTWILTGGADEETALANSSEAQYTPKASDEGKQIYVRATFTDSDGYGESMVSQLTEPIAEGTLLEARMTVASVTISGATYLGYSRFAQGGGSLSTQTFSIDGRTVSIGALGYHENADTILLTLTMDRLNEFVLRIGDTEFSSADASQPAIQAGIAYTWPRGSFTLTEGEVVVVKLKEVSE